MRHSSFPPADTAGDRVVGLIVTDKLFTLFPNARSAELTERGKKVVSNSSLAALATEMGLVPFIRVGIGEGQSGVKPKTQSDVFEAVAAAVYRDGGLVAAIATLGPILASKIAADAVQPLDPEEKNALMQYALRNGLGSPLYTMTKLVDSAHAPVFKVSLKIAGATYTAVSPTVKDGEKACAAEARAALGIIAQLPAAPAGPSSAPTSDDVSSALSKLSLSK